MYLTVPAIARRLADVLGPGWVVGHGNAPQERMRVPRADVRLIGAALQETKGRAVSLQARYQITLVVTSGHGGDVAFEALESAVTTAIAALHQWPPRQTLPTARLELLAIGESALPSTEVFGYDLAFGMSVIRHGFDPHQPTPIQP